MRQWAISVGINQYQFFQPLSYAQQDAQAIQQFLVDDVNLPAEQCFLLTETSPPQWGKSTYPDRENIQSWLDFVIQRCVQPGDLLWFFFSGYGICQQGQDYLVPIAGNPAAIQTTAIPLEAVFRSLRQASAATVLVLLDINRNESSFSYETVGNHTVHLASITGIPTLLSCQPEQFSRETSALGHGFFTAALLESLRSRQCTTVAALDQALSAHLPELSEHYWRPIQQPVTICPTEKRQQLILPTALTMQQRDRAAATHTTANAGTLDRANSANGNGHWAAATAAAATAAPANVALFAANGGVGNGGVSYGNSGTIAASDTKPTVHTVSSQRDSSQQDFSQRGFNGAASGSAYSANGVTSASAQNGVGTHYPLDTATQNHENRGTHSDRAATVTQPHPDYPEDTNEISDTLFWRSVLRWGGLAVVGLILGVLLRNYAAFTPKPASTAQQPATSSAGQGTTSQTGTGQTGTSQTGTGQIGSGQPGTGEAPASTKLSKSTKPSNVKGVTASPTVTPAVKPLLPQPIASTQVGAFGASRLNVSAGKTGAASSQPVQPTSIRTVAANTAKPSTQFHLAKARALASVNSDQASSYSKAIQEAKQVQPGQPDYVLAKQAIADWSSQILSIARQRGRLGQFDSAIGALELMPKDQPVHAEAKRALKLWCPALKAQRGAVQRQKAEGICRQGIS